MVFTAAATRLLLPPVTVSPPVEPLRRIETRYETAPWIKERHLDGL
jgi:hypothetical protein